MLPSCVVLAFSPTKVSFLQVKVNPNFEQCPLCSSPCEIEQTRINQNPTCSLGVANGP